MTTNFDSPGAPPLPGAAATLGPSPYPPTVPSDAVMNATGLSKSYGSLLAISDVSFSINSGITGLLGPNGAGKSTLLRLLCGLLRPSRGEVRVLGADPRVSPQARAAIGFVPEHDGVSRRLTVAQFLLMSAELSGVHDPSEAAQRAGQLLRLDRERNTRLGALSKGFRQRAKIASSIVHDPAIVVLDEPFNGLDPRQRRSIIDLFIDLEVAGTSVVVSSHVLAEVEEFCSTVLVLARGRLAAKGDFRQLRTLMSNEPLRYRLKVQEPNLIASHLVALGLLHDLSIRGNTVELGTFKSEQLRKELISFCTSRDLVLEEFEPLDEDLESVFRHITG